MYDSNRIKNIHFNGTKSYVLESLPLLYKYNVHTCSISDDEVNANDDTLKHIISSGMHVFVYVVNHTRRRKNLHALGITGVFSDFLLLCEKENFNIRY